MHSVLPALFAFLVSLAGCWTITQSALLKNVGNVAPSENRWHQSITPGLGGIPIFIGFLGAAILSGAIGPLGNALFIAAIPLLVLGTVDDLKPLTPKTKLFIQIASALLFVALIAMHNHSAAFDSSLNNPRVVIHWLVCGFWLIAITNAINLLDNMDGLAAGVALIASLTIAYLAGQSETLSGVSKLYSLLAASLAGFLVLNKNPAKLFMGDAGALWIGFTLAAGVVILITDINSSAGTNVISGYTLSWALAIVICAVPISDTLMVMITRKLRGQAVSIGGKDHLSHRLVALGLSEKTSVAILWIVALIASALALLVNHLQPVAWIMSVTVLGLLIVICTYILVSKTPIAAVGSVQAARQSLP